MHHALQIQEVLFNILDYCYSPDESDNSDMVSLARTCRAFKEPALNVLWEELPDLSPLARCVLEASRRSSPGQYSFSRPLSETEWDILQSYTRRIRSILDFQDGLDEESVRVLTDTPTTKLLFPTLRCMRCICICPIKTMHLLRLPFPSLDSLDLYFNDLRPFQEFFVSLPALFPAIRKIYLYLGGLDAVPSKFVSDCIRCWTNLWFVVCPQIALDADALTHLSGMPALNQLEFTLNNASLAFKSPLSFSNLHDLTISSEFLDTISQLLSQIRLPVATELAATIRRCLSRDEFTSFLANIQAFNTSHTIQNLMFSQSPYFMDAAIRSEGLSLGLDDLRSCMAFSDLRCLDLNVEWSVDLTDSQLVTLATAWPNLEVLLINQLSGWNTRGGITPNGLVQLLQACRLLHWIALVMDTRGYTELPPGVSQESLRLTLLPEFTINVLDSVIEAESVPALSAFLAAILPGPDFQLYAWRSDGLVKPANWEEYKNRWNDLFGQASATAGQYS